MWLESTSVSTWVRESGSLWAYPTVLAAHTLGMSVLVGANAVLDLRLLGVADKVPRQSLAGVFRALWAGAVVSVLSGLLLFGADASTKGTTTVFFVKLACIALGLAVAWRLRRLFEDDAASRDERSGRVVAIVSLLLWTGALTAGRFMAYLTPGPS